jgi:RimJ/RimL family protein N-acetyltransferase
MIAAEPVAVAAQPIIETERLVLTRPSTLDFAELAEMAAGEAMFRFSERGPMTVEESWGLLLRHVGQWTATRYGVFTLREKAGGRFAGLVGASDFQRQFGTDFDAFPEMTWSIPADLTGQGLATEAAEAALAWLGRETGATRAVCLIHAENKASLRVAEKLGFRAMRRRDYRGYPAILLDRGLD